MGLTLGSLAVMSGFRPSALVSFSRLSALIELRSMFLAVMVLLVMLVLAYLTNPSETSFRAFLTEQAFRHHLSRLGDADSQDEGEVAGSPIGTDPPSRRGPGTSRHRSSGSYASSPFPFASRASVSLRTPKHIFRSYGILSIAAVVPSQPNQPLSVRAHSDSESAQKSVKDTPRMHASMTLDSWFIGAFGMWFWAANFDGLWRDAGWFTKDEVDGTISGILEIKAPDRYDELNCNSYASDANLSFGQQHRILKPRSRDQLTRQNGLARQRSQSPPPLPKSASLPLHTKRESHPIASDKLLHGSHFSSPAFSVSSSSSDVQLSPPAIVSDSRSITPICSVVAPVIAGTLNDAISRSPSALFGSSPLIAEILKQLSTSQSAVADLRTQLSDFHTSSASTRAALEEELEGHRSRKRSDDAARVKLRIQIKHLEDQKRMAEGARRDAEKRLKTASAERDITAAKTERFEREMREIHAKMESHGAAIVASGVENAALTADLDNQIEAKRAEIRDVEDEIAQLGMAVREVEEKISNGEKRLERAIAEADLRKQEQNRKVSLTRLQSEGLELSGDGNIPDEHWETPSRLRMRHPEGISLEGTNNFQSSPSATSVPTSPSSTEPLFRRLSSQAIPTPSLANSASLKQFPLFDSETAPLRTFADLQTSIFAPFNDHASTSIISPTSESLLPSSLYESLGMGNPVSDSPESPMSLAPAVTMDVSRSFQSEDDVILDRNWLKRRNSSAGGVGQPFTYAARVSCSSLGNPSSSPGGDPSDHDVFGPFIQQHSGERHVSLRMDAQRAALPLKPFVTDYSSPLFEYPDMFTQSNEAVQMHGSVPKCPGWFSSSKEKDAKVRERKGLNPDAKEFSLSKDKERSLSVLMSRSRASVGSTSSGSSSTPSSASPATSDSHSMLSTPLSIMAPAPPQVSPLSSIHSRKSVPARAASSLLSLGSSWFGSRTFAPTPMEREQLSRVLGGSANMSLDRLPNLQTNAQAPTQQQAPTSTLPQTKSLACPSPQSRTLSLHSHSTSGSGLLSAPIMQMLPTHRKWGTAPSRAIGSVLHRTGSSFSPFADDEAETEQQQQHKASSGGNVRGGGAPIDHANGSEELKRSSPVSTL